MKMRMLKSYFLAVAVVMLFLLLALGCAFKSTTTGATASGGNRGRGYIVMPQNLAHKYYGFNVFRSEKRNGQYVQVNREIFPARGTGGDKPFLFVDDQLIMDKEYYYYIEGITFAGKKERVTPPFKAVPE